MKCKSCNQREATIAFTRIAGDDKQVLHLCAGCAERIARQEKGTGQEIGEAAGTPTPAAGQGAAEEKPGAPAAAAGLASSGAPAGPAADKPPKVKVSIVAGHLAGSDTAAACADCGMTYEEFRKVGRFGCAHCYVAFAPHLQRLLKRVHGATRHLGRSPAVAAAPPHPAQDAPAGPGAASPELDHLREELQEAVAAEAYERAAELRDRITQMQAQREGQA